MPQGYKLSEIKTKIRNVLANLDVLEGLSNGQLSDNDLDQSQELERCTTTLLLDLEELPCEKIARTQLQRHRRRRRAKQKAKLQKRLNRTATKQSTNTAIQSKSNKESAMVQKQAEHITLKKLHDATNILHTLDLLERLYKARGGDENMAHKLSKVRTVWQRVRHECKNASPLETTSNFDAQWARAIFGNTSQNVRQMKPETQELKERRIVWDSYISYDKTSSCIPNGWVLPPDNPAPEWAMFKCE